MKRVVALALTSALCFGPASTWSQSNPVAIFAPSPLSIILMVGKWMAEPGSPRVYHIRVQAKGATESEARREAYKRAIEEAIGSLVLSESVVVNEELRRREIIEYSSGYVDRFKMHDQRHDGRHFVVDMEIWVKHSAIADRLLVKAESTREIDGLRIQQQVETLNYERSQGLRVLSVVMDDYPHRAYDIRDQDMAVKYNGRGADLDIEFTLSFNASYLYALWETLKNVSQNANSGSCYPNCREPWQVYMEGRRDRLLFNRWAWSFGFTEPDKLQVMHQAMFASNPSVLLQIRDGGGRVVHASCHQWAELDGQVRFQYPSKQFVHFDGYRLVIDGTFPFRARIELRDLRNISQAKTVDLTLVRGANCPQ